MCDILYLPVSIGEAVDKLTILDIKLEFIKDSRKDDVKKEYDILYDKLKNFIDNHEEYYKLMKQINLDIWHMMDILRDSEISNEDYMIKCKECIEANDMRFRIKNKINMSSNSVLKEQKGYNILRIIIDITDIKFDIYLLINPFKYYSYLYDEIIILADNENKEILEKYFNYDNTIKIMNSCNLEHKVFINLNNSYNIDDILNTLNISKETKIKYFN